MDLVRDLLDKAVFDRNGREMGRVDGIVLEQGNGGPPRIAAIEIGPTVLAYRIRPSLARWADAFERAWGVGDGRPVRIAARDITKIDEDITVDVAIGQTAAEAVEQKLRRFLRKFAPNRR
jgi:sporulation protein YlmC with PRC-barrel domain